MKKQQTKGSAAKVEKTPEIKTPKLDLVWEFTNDVPGPLRLLTDGSAWYLGDKGKQPVKVNIADALEWFVAKDAITHDGNGSIARLALAAANELRTKERTQGVIKAEFAPIPPDPETLPTSEFGRWLDDRKAAIEKRTSSVVDLPLKVSLSSYGIFCEAGAVHGCSAAEALDLFVDSTDFLFQWADEGYPLSRETHGPPPPKGETLIGKRARL